MSALPKLMSLDEFVAWEERQELRYEYDGATARAMTGGTSAHARIQANLIAALVNRLRGGPRFAVGSELKIRTTTSLRYPDAMVICGPLSSKATQTSNPTVLFEVLSPSSAGLDLGVKNGEYQTLPSLRRYVAVHQDLAAAEVFFRDEEGEWRHEFADAETVLAMPEIGVELPLAEAYLGVEFARPR